MAIAFRMGYVYGRLPRCTIRPIFKYPQNTIFRSLSCEPVIKKYFKYGPPLLLETRVCCIVKGRNYSSFEQGKHGNLRPSNDKDKEKKLGLVQRFKDMYRKYWYVLVPVHLVTSGVWLGGFYYLIMSGVDMISFLQSIGVSEKIIEPMRDSKAGYFALTYALYKIATPLRYAVTLGGTTYSINKLTALGLIKPVPSRDRIKEIIQEKKEDLTDKIQETKQEFKQRRELIKERKDQVINDIKRYKQEMKNIKQNEVKSKVREWRSRAKKLQNLIKSKKRKK